MLDMAGWMAGWLKGWMSKSTVAGTRCARTLWTGCSLKTRNWATWLAALFPSAAPTTSPQGPAGQQANITSDPHLLLCVLTKEGR